MQRAQTRQATPNRTRKLLTVILVVALSSASSAFAVSAGGSFTGLSLIEALGALGDLGLEIFYTSNLVRPEMRVEVAPSASEPRMILEELLAPHGLTAESGPGGRLVVVAAPPPPAGISGRVIERYSGTPVPGVRIVIPGVETEVLSAGDGSFRVPEVAAGTHKLEAHLPGYVVEHLEIEVTPGEDLQIIVELDPAKLSLDEIIVTPSRISLNSQDPVTGLDLDREDIFALPHLGDDIFRALTLLPGVTGEESSARFNVRGGRTDEVLIMLDRVELFEPFHLKDYGSALSIVTPRALEEVNLITGGFPAEYGDRMSGVLDMNTFQPRDRKTLLGLSLLTAEVGTSGTFDDQRGDWITSARRGQLDLALEFFGQEQKPHYWDAFGKVNYQVRSKHRVGLHVLHSEDDLDFFQLDIGDTQEDYLTNYGSSYVWLTHQAILGSRLFVDTAISRGRVDRDRRATELELDEDDPNAGLSLVDVRELNATGLKQDWNYQRSEGHYLKWGFDVRRLETDYDYTNERILDDPLEDVRFEPRTGVTRFEQRLSGEQYSGYLSSRSRPIDAFTVELGLRYDEHTITRDSNVSPRINLVYAPGEKSTLRLAWGYFYQSQRPYELQVEDGVTDLVMAERTEQRVIGFEHQFPDRGSGLLLRVEAYHREIDNPRGRYENIFQPVEIFPETEPDRVLFAPDDSRAYGLEVFLRGRAGQRIEWWTSYAYSKIEDLIDGLWIPRRNDQPHAFNFDLNYRAGKHWNVNLAWRYHTGWPTTTLSGFFEEDDEGELEIVTEVGPLHAERLSDYHRLDLRASREWRKSRGVLGFFLEVQNAYNRKNHAGFDPDLETEEAPDGGEIVVLGREIWQEILPSFGITWEF